MKYFLKIWLCGIFLFPILCVNAIPEEEPASELRAEYTGRHAYASSSVLATGKWVKIKIKETGIYRITYEDLIGWGFSNPANVQLYGYGGGMLSEDFRLPKIDDLPHIPVWVEKKNPTGSFVAGDYILFYAQGTVKREYNTSTNEKFRHINNPYSDYGYYFITESGNPTKQMLPSSEEGEPVQEITTFNDYVIHEKDLVNIGRTGREFYGEDFSFNTSQNFTMNTPGITGNAFINVSFIARNTTSNRVPVTVRINGTNELRSSITGPCGDYERAREAVVAGIWEEALRETNTVNTHYGTTGHANTRLNYIRINYDRQLRLYGAYTLFRNVAGMNKVSKYTVSGVNQNVKIWNITDKANVFQVGANSGSSGTELSFISISKNSELQEFAAVDVSKKDQYPKPDLIGEIKNQNLHALPQTDMVIISHSDFLEQAGRIAELHRKHDNLRIHVVTADEVYNEFSSGTPDASAYRWFMKMFYDRGKRIGDEKELPKYLLLFGDGTFDNKLLMTNEWRIHDPGNKLLTYQSYQSLSESSACVIEDYFGFLTDDAGWEPPLSNPPPVPLFDTTFPRALVDIGVGRFPVRNATEAKNVADKIIAYIEKPVYGPWKNNICFLADDNSKENEVFDHMIEADDIVTTYFEPKHANSVVNKNYIVHKIYLETFQKLITSSGYNYPDANKKVQQLLQSGIFMFNYTGHGMPAYLASEQIYTANDAWNMRVTRLPVFITATCEFARFDDFTTSGGEAILLSSTGGGIAAFSTTRVVYSKPNLKINKQFCKNLFTKGADGNYPRLGDVLRLSKRYLVETGEDHSINKLAFVLMGDPALRLVYPEYKTRITSVNEQDADISQTFSAGAPITIKGEITTPDGNVASDFSGLAYFTLLDSKENYFQAYNKAGNHVQDFYDQSRVLYTGKEPVTNGRFSVSFIIPKDMSYSYDPGRLNVYAADPENKAEAQGYFENFKMGGTIPDLPDTDPPEIISAYLNHSDFKSGDTVNDSPIFFATVKDQSGINISGSGVGRNPVIIIDNLAYETYSLNNYFEAETGNPGAGTFTFKIPTLSSGKHQLKFRVWNIMNNAATHTFNFTVKKDLSPKIFDLDAYPNPAKEGTNFRLKHDRPDSKITIRIDVFNLAGAKMWSIEQSEYAEVFEAHIPWNLQSSYGQKIPPGVYVYRATISADGSTETTEAKKLIILAQ